MDLGFTYLETDVHVSADGVLIAFHDDRLDRVTDRRGLVANLSWSEIRVARVAGREPILRFEELLATFPDARINVEPKHDAAVGPLVETIRRNGALDRICVGSFADRRLAAVREALPGVCTSLGTLEIAGLRAAAWGAGPFRRRLARRPGLCVQVPTRAYGIPLVNSAFLRTAHELGLPVHVWTVNDAAEMERLLDLGVDGLMSDHPGRLRAVFEGRGIWSASTASRIA